MARSKDWSQILVRALCGAMLCSVSISLVGCGSSTERQVIQKYFSAARLRDQTTLSNMATVSFEPQQDGVVVGFEITNAGPEQTRTLRLQELRKQHDEARAADEEFSKRKKAYQDQNLEAIDRVLRAERQSGRITGRDAEVQVAWTKWRDEMAQHAKRVAATRSQLAQERVVAETSVFDARNPVDVTQHNGELISKDVTIAARVRKPDGQVANKTLIVTMQRAKIKREDGSDLTGRWIITGIKEAGAAASTS